MDIDKLPLSIKKFVMNKPYKIDSVGESGSKVIIIDDWV